MYCEIPNAHNSSSELQNSIQQRVDIRGECLCSAEHNNNPVYPPLAREIAEWDWVR
jgi:hypothetical protein